MAGQVKAKEKRPKIRPDIEQVMIGDKEDIIVGVHEVEPLEVMDKENFTVTVDGTVFSLVMGRPIIKTPEPEDITWDTNAMYARALALKMRAEAECLELWADAAEALEE